MPLTQVVRVPSMVAYVPPLGFRIVSVRKLEDGSYEVTLEPLVLPSSSSGWGRPATRPCPAMIVTVIDTMLSTIKR
jgi:hypothetical protein